VVKKEDIKHFLLFLWAVVQICAFTYGWYYLDIYLLHWGNSLDLYYLVIGISWCIDEIVKLKIKKGAVWNIKIDVQNDPTGTQLAAVLSDLADKMDESKRKGDSR